MHQDSKLKRLFYRLSLLIPDTWYLSLKYYKNFGELPNLKYPKTFNEKLQWLKLHDRKPIYTTMVDKYEVKQYVANIIGEKYIIPTLGVWDRAEDINFDSLPNQFVLKATHDSGRVVICKDKTTLNRAEIIKEMRKSLQRNFYAVGREWPYKNVKRRIIAEKYMEDGEQELKDYKLMCFNGKVYCSFVCSERENRLKVTFYDRDWKRLPFERHYPAAEKDIPKPKQKKKMVCLAEILSKKIPFVRTDFYETNGQLYFGELTFFPGSGVEEFTPKEWDERLGKLIVLHQ